MQQGKFTILENAPLTKRVSRLRLLGDCSAVTRPGQFADLRLDGFFLRRPFSVCDAEGDCLTLLYETAGRGTEALRRLPAGTELDVLTGLGNGYDLSRAGSAPLLVGGGTGASPLYGLAKALIAEGKAVSVILGFAGREDVFYEEEFRALGADVTVCTEDGSCGVPGFATAGMDRPYSYFYTCGSKVMMEAVCRAARTDGQLSFAVRMGCGFGACMGCTLRTAAGLKRVCKDGPVFGKEEIMWEDWV
ncbi:MAG: dihydroorotate dehydrogenase electron transfer subunit [Oscillospiraceae bacterium]|nr:dihydroorotate dehydrogenase electron transfer subunit [Oscillospiraceae bacterium]